MASAVAMVSMRAAMRVASAAAGGGGVVEAAASAVAARAASILAMRCITGDGGRSFIVFSV